MSFLMTQANLLQGRFVVDTLKIYRNDWWCFSIDTSVPKEDMG